MLNPIVQKLDLSYFSTLDLNTIERAIQQNIAENNSTLTLLLSQQTFASWESLLLPLETMEDTLANLWAPVMHLYHVAQSETLRRIYHTLLPLLNAHHTEIAQNIRLFKILEQIIQHSDFSTRFSFAQRKIIETHLRHFKLAGVHLPTQQKKQFLKLEQKLSQLSTQFANNLLDATESWTLSISSSEPLVGLPPSVLQFAQSYATQQNQTGYLLTLDQALYFPAIKYLNNRQLRQTLYEAYVTRASDQGPLAGKWDNSPIIESLLSVRLKMSKLVGFAHFAEYSLATKMANTPSQVLTFLKDLILRSKPLAQREWERLSYFAKDQDQLDTLQPWDIAYYSEKLKRATLGFTQEDCRPYFPIHRVLQGLFHVVSCLFRVTFHQETLIDTWHPSVLFFSLYDQEKQLRGGIYMDLYTRPHKQEGAWMDVHRSRRLYPDQQKQRLQYPVAYLTCNFIPPTPTTCALLTHNDVTTLFHEFGHCLHHVLTTVEYSTLSGVNGVAWDAIEFPSQFLENFCWGKSIIHLCSRHYQTGESMPDSLCEKIIQTQSFQAGLNLLRQLKYALFDFQLHLTEKKLSAFEIQAMLDSIHQETSFYPAPIWQRIQHSFSHIFSGGYAAGYYSYLWAEVLSADAFEYFEQNGLLNAEIGHSFMRNILEVGGIQDLSEAFIAFRGRAPDSTVLLRRNGIITPDN